MNLSVSSLGISGLENVEQIGTGGSSRVYRAHEVDLDREVAVKVINSGDDPDVARRFDRERKAMGRLSQNEGIVPVYSTGVTGNGEPYLVMPYYANGSLQDRIDRGPLAWREAVDYTIRAADTIGTAHDQGIVHLDLKPANILLSESDAPRIADFGIAKLTSANSTARTTGTAFTPAYSAPETFLDGITSPASDVYGLGATLWALIGGYPPFLAPNDDNNLMAVIGRVVNNKVADLSHVCPPSVFRVIERAMAKKPEDRYQTASEFADGLRGALDRVGDAPVRESAAPGQPGRVSLLFPELDDAATGAMTPGPAEPALVARTGAPVTPGPSPTPAPDTRTTGPAVHPGPAAHAAPAMAPGPDIPSARIIDAQTTAALPAWGDDADLYATALPDDRSNSGPGGYEPPYGATPGYGEAGYNGSGSAESGGRSLLQQTAHPRSEPIQHELREPMVDLDRFRLGPLLVVGVMALMVGILSVWALTRNGDTATTDNVATDETVPVSTEPANPSISVSSTATSTAFASDSSTTATTVGSSTTASGVSRTTVKESTASSATTARSTTTDATPTTAPVTSSTTSTTERSSTTTTAGSTTASTTATTAATTSTTVADVRTPSGLTAQVDGASVDLAWEAPASGPRPNGYKVYRDDVLVNTVDGLSYTDDNVDAGTHSYTVTAVIRGSSGSESDPSAAKTVTVPLVLTSSSMHLTKNSIVVGITANDCVRYRLSWVNTVTNKTEAQTSTECVTSAEPEITGLSPDTRYVINVTAIDQQVAAAPLQVVTPG